jgi:hypothetical protein
MNFEGGLDRSECVFQMNEPCVGTFAKRPTLIERKQNEEKLDRIEIKLDFRLCFEFCTSWTSGI